MKVAIPVLTVILAAILSFSAYKIHKKMVDKLPPVERIYAYEVDGLGRNLTDFDDANVPSLLSMPLLGWKGYDQKVYIY